MHSPEPVSVHLQGYYRDRLRDASGNLVSDRGWKRNAIVVSCRQLLAGFMKGEAGTLGIRGLRIGQGDPAWDQQPPQPPNPTASALVDANSFLVEPHKLTISYLAPDSDADSLAPTNRIQIVATIGPGDPPWPETPPVHTDSTIREFGLVGQLNGNDVLINYVTHPAIAKDRSSTLERTIWLVF